MDIVRAFAGARVVRARGRLYLVSPPSMRGLAQLAAFLGDATGEASGVGKFADPEANDRLLSPEGLPHLVYATFRRDEPGLSFGDCPTLALAVEPDDYQRLIEVALYGGPPAPDDDDAPAPPDGTPGADVDLALADWGMILARLRRAGIGQREAEDMTLDQVVNTLRGGRVVPKGRPMTFAEVLALYESNRPGDGTPP